MQKAPQNCIPPENCPSCGAVMATVNEFGLRQCSRRPPCPGMVWQPELGWNPASQEGALERRADREHIREKTHPLEPMGSSWAGRCGLSMTTSNLAR